MTTQLFLAACASALLGGWNIPITPIPDLNLPLPRNGQARILDYAGFSSGSGYDNGNYQYAVDASNPNSSVIQRGIVPRMTFDFGGFEAIDGLLFVQQVATLHIFDLATDRNKPTRLGMFDTGLRLRSSATPVMSKFVSGSAMQFARSGDVLFLGCENVLIAVDISDPAHPIELSRIDAFDPLLSIEQMKLVGDTLIIVQRPERTASENLTFMDVSDPTAMGLIKRTPVDDFTAILVQGEYLFALGNHELHTYSIGADWELSLVNSVSLFPEHMTEDSFWELTSLFLADEVFNRYPPAGQIIASGNRLYVLDREELTGLYFELDVSDPANPVPLAPNARAYQTVEQVNDGTTSFNQPVGYDLAVAGDRVYSTQGTLTSWSVDPTVPDVTALNQNGIQAGMLLTSDGPFVYGVNTWRTGTFNKSPGSPAGSLWIHDSRQPSARIVTLPTFFYDVTEGDRNAVTGGVTDGRNLYVHNARSILAMDIQDMNRVEPVGRTNRLDAELPNLKTNAFDASQGYVYALARLNFSDVGIICYDAHDPSAMVPVWTHKIADSTTPIDQYDFVIEVCANYMFYSTPGRTANTRTLQVYSVSDPTAPKFLASREISYDPSGPVNTQSEEKMVYQDGILYWLLSPSTFVALDATDLDTLKTAHTFPKQVLGGVSQAPTDHFFFDYNLSGSRLLVTRSQQGVISPFVYEEYDISSMPPTFKTFQQFAGNTGDFALNVMPLGDRIYSVTSLDSPIDSLHVTGSAGRVFVAGIPLSRELVIRPSAPAQIPFGATGLILRYGVTAYELPNATRPNIQLESTRVLARRSGERVSTRIFNANSGPMKWYVHDDPSAREWCHLWGHDSGENGNSLVVDVDTMAFSELESREATFTIYAPGAVPSYRTVVISQESITGVHLLVDPDSFVAGANSWILTATVDTNTGIPVPWTAWCEKSWVRFTSGNGGVGRTTMTITLDPNPYLAAREGTILIDSPDLFEGGTEMAVKQTGRISGGEVNAIDVQAVINAILTGQKNTNLDVNDDGDINASDVQMTVNGALGLYR